MRYMEKAFSLKRSGSNRQTGPAFGPLEEPGVPAAAPTVAHSRDCAPAAALLRPRVEAAGYALIGPCAPGLSAQFRNIRDRLLEIVAPSTQSAVALISVSSAVPGEGKSFTSLNLSLSLAALPRTNVTLVDFDQVRCRMTRLFDCVARPGLIDALAAPASFQSFRYGTDVANLSFMPIGTTPRTHAELLSGHSVDAIVAAMREGRERCERQFFVFDCPPMLANEDAKYISQRSDLALIVVKAGSTPRGWTSDALEKIGTKAHVALILNNRVSSITEQRYDYGETLKDYLDSG